jgi:APA family basic amino acid/polyamine antiporter
MSSYRQLPEVFRRLHPRFKTPWLALILFAGVFSCLFMLPGNVDFIGRMYAFGAMLSFTIAHFAVIQMRRKPPPVEEPYRMRPNLRVRGVDWPLFAILGGAATAVAWLVVVVQDAPTRYAGLAWLAAGFVFYAIYRHRLGISLRETSRAPLLLGPAIALEYRNILVPVVRGPSGQEAIDLAARLAAERGATIVALRVIAVPLDLPLDAELLEQEELADRLLDDARNQAELYGVRMIERLVRSRSAGRAIVEEAERRQSEIVVLGAPRAERRQIFGPTADYVLKHAPCRVMVAAGIKAA